MPIYEYQCQDCGHELEALQKMSDPKLTQCPECDKPSLTKKVSAAAFRLKGGGWYETDFKTGDKKKNLVGDDKPASSSGSESKSDTSGSTKSDSKPSSESSGSKAASSSSSSASSAAKSD